MPINPENAKLYPANWDEISKRIRHERAGNKCEQCKAPNGELIARGECDDAGTYLLGDGQLFDADDGEFLGYRRGSEYIARRLVKVVLTVAHLDHDPTHNDETNLKALCQRCHLAHDKDHHQKNARATRRSRKAAGELFPEEPKR